MKNLLLMLWMLNIMEQSKSVHQVKILKLSLILDLLIFGFHQRHVGQLLVSFILLIIPKNHLLIKLMEPQLIFNTEVEELKELHPMML